MGYKQLDYLTRCKIYGLWRAGLNQTEIANEIKVHKSTISRELKRNITFVRTKLGSWQYKPIMHKVMLKLAGKKNLNASNLLKMSSNLFVKS